MSFDLHTSDICSNSFFHLKALRHIRSKLDRSTENSIACSFVASRLDYCNAILAGMLLIILNDCNAFRIGQQGLFITLKADLAHPPCLENYIGCLLLRE